MFKVPMIFSGKLTSRSLTTHSSAAFNSLIRKHIKWDPSKEHVLNIKGTLYVHKDYSIRIGNYPTEPLYALFKGNNKVHEFQSIPKNWTIKDRYKPSSKIG